MTGRRRLEKEMTSSDHESHEPAQILRFGVFELHLVEQELRRSGVKIQLAPQPFRTLAYLVARSQQIATRDELQLHVWGQGTFVDAELGLNSCIKKIRQALGDDAVAARFVETVPRRGYRFVAPVETCEPPTSRPRPRLRPWLWLVAAGIAAVLISMFALAFRDQEPTPAKASPRARPKQVLLAVLPIEDLRPLAPDPHLAAGLHEALMVRLARHLPEGLGILDHASTASLQGPGALPADLEVDFVLHSSLRDTVSGTKFAARLVKSQDGLVLWSDEFEVDSEGQLGTQERVAAAASAALSGEFHARAYESRSPAARRESISSIPEATEAHLKGLYLLLQGSRAHLARARPLFEQAIALDPALAPAHAALAKTFYRMVFAGLLPAKEGFPLARGAALEALRFDPHEVDAHLAKGYVELYLDHSLEAAERSFTEAANASPGLARTHSALASWAGVAQRHRRAIWEARLARDLDPLGLSVNADLCWYLLYADNYEGARVECERSLELEPSHQWTLMGLSEALLGVGLEAEAAGALRRAFRIPEDAQLDSVEAIWARLSESLVQGGKADAFTVAAALSRAGDLEQAMASLEEAKQVGSFWLAYVHVDPRLDPLRARRDFRQLAEGLGLPSVPTADHADS